MRLAGSLVILIVLITSTAWGQNAPPITTGELYCYGNAIDAPFTITATSSTVTINGVQVYPKMSATKADEQLTPSAASLRHASLYDRFWTLERTLREQNTPLDVITTGIANIALSDTALIASVTDVQPGSMWIVWRDTGCREEIIVTAGPLTTTPLDKRLQDEIVKFRGLLERGCLVIVSSAESKFFAPSSPERFRAIRKEIERARTTANDQLTDSTWNGEFLTSSIALQFKYPLTAKEDQR